MQVIKKHYNHFLEGDAKRDTSDVRSEAWAFE
jgi:hypothetical protein